MICVFLNKGLPYSWNWINDVVWRVFFYINDAPSGGIDSVMGDYLSFSEQGIAAMVELTHWFWIICIFLSRGLPQWWIDSLMVKDLFFLNRGVFLNKGLVQWWNWLTVFGWFVFFLIRDCRSGGLTHWCWRIFFSEQGIAAVIKLTHW